MHPPDQPDEAAAAGDADAEVAPSGGATDPTGPDDEGWVEV
jgi:hypothetical protein